MSGMKEIDMSTVLIHKTPEFKLKGSYKDPGTRYKYYMSFSGKYKNGEPFTFDDVVVSSMRMIGDLLKGGAQYDYRLKEAAFIYNKENYGNGEY